MTTITHTGYYHHLSTNGLDLDGLTLRQAMELLRGVDWGDMGGLSDCILSDGRGLSVQLRSDSPGQRLLASQEIAITTVDGGHETRRAYSISRRCAELDAR